MDDVTGTGLSDLLDLQEVDLAIDRLLHQRETLPELAALARARTQLAALEVEHQERHDQLRRLERDEDKAEGELEILEAKLKESETRLFAGGMSARETEQKRLEVQALRGQQDAMEGRALAILDQLDPLREEEARITKARDEAKAEVARLEGIVAAAWKEIDAHIARREASKRELAAPIPGELLNLYEQLRRSKEGVAIGRLDGGVCGGCHLTLSIPEQREAAEWDPPRCIHCMRLLVM